MSAIGAYGAVAGEWQPCGTGIAKKRVYSNDVGIDGRGDGRKGGAGEMGFRDAAE